MKYVIPTADDFGFTPGVNTGCITAYTQGFVQELACMVLTPGAKEAAALAEKHGVNSIGLHLTLNDLNATGRYLHTADYVTLLRKISDADLEAIIKKEFEAFPKLFGTIPSHISSHQDIHAHPRVLEVVADFSREYSIPVRRPSHTSAIGLIKNEINEAVEKYKAANVLVSEAVFIKAGGTKEDLLQGLFSLLEEQPDGAVVEWVLRPGNVDALLEGYSSFIEERERDLEIALDETIVPILEEQWVQLTSYEQLHFQQGSLLSLD